MRRGHVMISRGDALPRAGLRRAGSVAVDPIGVALSITAGERSHPRTGTPPLIRPHGGRRTSRRRRTDRRIPACVRWLLRGDHCTGGSLAAPRVCLRPTRGNRRWTPMGSTYLYASFPQVRLWLTCGYRKFAPYGGAGLAVCLTSRRTFCRMGSAVTLSAARLFNTENRLFSRARSLARKYAKIGNSSFSGTFLRCSAARAPQTRNFATMCHKSALIFLLKQALDGKFHPLDRRIDGMEMDFHGMDRWCRRRDTQKSPLEARKNL